MSAPVMHTDVILERSRDQRSHVGLIRFDDRGDPPVILWLPDDTWGKMGEPQQVQVSVESYG